MAETLPYYLEKPDAPPEPVGGLKEFAGAVVGAAPQPTPDEAPNAEFKELSARLVGMSPNPPTREELDTAYAARDAARAKAHRNASDYAASQSLEIEATKKAAAAHAAEAAQRAPQTPPTLTPPPSRSLRPFLAPTQDQSPETTVGALLQSISLMATMVGGGRAGARASLSAMTGALEGWRAGDRERADREFGRWRAANETLMDQWQMEQQGYESWLKSAGLPIEQRLQGLKLDAMRRGNQKFADEIDVERARESVQSLEKRQESALKHAEISAKIIGAKEAADERLKSTREVQDRAYALKERMADEHIKASYAPKIPDDQMRTLAITEMNGGRVPSFGMGQSADRTRYQIVKAQTVMEMGGPGAVAARASALSGLKATQTQVMKVRGLVEAFSRTAEKNMVDAEKLSRTVDRTGSPMLNRWLLSGRKKWSGDPDVADFDVATTTVVNEVTRVLNTAQASGVISDSARKEIQELLDTAMTPEQFTRAVKRFRQEMGNRRTAYDEELSIMDEQIRTMGSDPMRPDKAPSESGAAPALPKNAHREGNEIISNSGKYRWDGKAWVNR